MPATPICRKAKRFGEFRNCRVLSVTSNAGPNKPNNAVNSDYTAYGRLDQLGLVGSTTISGAQTIIDTRLANLCTAMKAKGVVIYTIVFTGTRDANTKAMYQACATDQSKFFDAPTQTDLANAFSAIAVQLSNLRVTQ